MNKLLSLSLLLFAVSLISSVGVQQVFADVVSPKKQMKLNFSSDEIICKEGFIRITNINDVNAACVKISSVDKLVKFGWAQPLDETLLAMRMAGELQPIGTVNILDKVKILAESVKLESSSRIVGYDVIFEACAKSTVRAPEVIVKSDSEIKRVMLSEKIDANTCQITSAKIKTNDPNSIKATMTNKGGVSEKITSLENKINGLKQNLLSERTKLSLVTNSTIPDTTTSEAMQKIPELRNNITKLSDELNRYRLALYVESSQIAELKSKSFSDSLVDGSSIVKIASYKSLFQPNNLPKNVLAYNIIYQICAESNAIHTPDILVTSDVQTKSVRLPDVIQPNSCQKGSVDINSEKAQSISLLLKNNEDKSSSIDEIEKKIIDIQEKLKTEKENLATLIHKKPRPIDYDKTVNVLTEKIEQLRNDLNKSKVSLYYLLNNR